MLDENLTLERLNQFPVVLLPNTAILSKQEINLLRRYVEEGGNLIITGMSGCYDHTGRLHSTSSLEALIGAKLIRRLDSLDNWVRFTLSQQTSTFNQQLCRGIRTDWPFLVKGPAVVLEPKSAISIGELLQPFRTTRQCDGKEGTEWPMSADYPVGPAILLNYVGRGKVLTFACSPDYAVSSEHYIIEARRLLTNAVNFLNPNPRVRIIAPVTVQTVVNDEPSNRTLRIHLLGYNSPPQTTPPKNRPYVLPGLIEDSPMYKATFELNKPIKRVTVLNESTELKKSDRCIEVTVNDIHEVVSISY